MPGDVVVLQAGDRVPADVRLFRVRSLQVNESALTGESVPVHKHAEPLALDTMLADRKNLAFTGTLVTGGRGEGVVWATADQTETGNVIVLVEIAYVFNCRSLNQPFISIGPFTNSWVIVGALAMLGAQMLFTYSPLMNRLFHSAPLGADSWLRIASVAAAVFIVVEIEKWIRFGRGRGEHALPE